MLIYGGWLLSLWVTIQITRRVYFGYPYLKVGIAFWSLAVVALLCIIYADRKRGFWSALFIVPVITGFWTMAVIPNIAPFDTKSPSHVRDVATELEAFSQQHGRFPDDETALPAEVLQQASPYYQDGTYPSAPCWCPMQ